LSATSAARAALRDRCVASFRRLSRALNKDDEEWLSLDLTMGQFKALMALGLKGPLAIGDLGRRIGISEPAASLLVDQLEAKGLVSCERDPKDRRRTLVTPVAEAQERFERLHHGRMERVFGLLERLADEDLEALVRGIGALEDIALGVQAPTAEGGRA
jgi:DNA-binding MarR family transcriptional regulator